MDSKEEHRKKSLDKLIDEKFAEIFFLAKEEYGIESNSIEERELYDFLNAFEVKMKLKCKKYFEKGNE